MRPQNAFQIVREHRGIEAYRVFYNVFPVMAGMIKNTALDPRHDPELVHDFLVVTQYALGFAHGVFEQLPQGWAPERIENHYKNALNDALVHTGLITQYGVIK